jgi:hypothetical protein
MRIRLHNNDLDSINASEKTGFFRRTPMISGTVDMMVSVGPNFFYTLTLWFYDRGQAGGVRHKLQAATRYSDVQ